MNKQFTFTLAICLFANSLFSQQIEWEQTYLMDSFLVANPIFEVHPTPDNGFILCGTMIYENALNHHFARVIKTDDEGNELWSKLYFHDPQNFEFKSDARAIRPTGDGNWFVGGSLHINHNPQALLMKINPLGDTIWTKTYNPNDTDEIFGMTVTEDGGTLLVGQSGHFTDEISALLIRTDADGNLLWTKNYAREILHENAAFDVVKTPDNGFFLTGTDRGGVLLIKTDSEGDTLWTKTKHISKTDVGISVKTLQNGGYMIGGAVSGIAGHFPLIFNVDEDGNDIWAPFLSVPLGSASSVIPTNSGGAVYTGSGIGLFPLAIWQNGFVAEVDADGNEIWNIPLPGDVIGFHIEPLGNDEYLVAGNSGDAGYLAKIGKTNSTLDKDKNDIYFNVFPNPSSDKIQFKIENPEARKFRISIFDLTGKSVRKATFESSEFEIEKGDLSGMYFYELRDEKGGFRTGKIVFE